MMTNIKLHRLQEKATRGLRGGEVAVESIAPHIKSVLPKPHDDDGGVGQK